MFYIRFTCYIFEQTLLHNDQLQMDLGADLEGILGPMSTCWKAYGVYFQMVLVPRQNSYRATVVTFLWVLGNFCFGKFARD